MTGLKVWRPGAAWRLRRFARLMVPLALIAGLFVIVVRGPLTRWVLAVCVLICMAALLNAAARPRRARRARSREIRRLADERHWSFEPEDHGMGHRWSTYPFGIGRDRQSLDVVAGANGEMPCAAFLYQYTLSDGSSPAVHDVTTVRLRVALPTLHVRRKTLGESAPRLFLPQVALENETFNRRYRVHAADIKFASDVLSPRAMEALLSVEPFNWFIEGRDLVAWGPPIGDATGVFARLDALATVARNIPEFVLTEAERAGPG